jgi:hypothetical protein
MSRKKNYAERQAAREATATYDEPIAEDGEVFACFFVVTPGRARVGDQVAACIYRNGGKARLLEGTLLAFFDDKANAQLVANQLVEIDPTIRLSRIQEF